MQDIREKVASGNITHVRENYGALNERDKCQLERRDVRQIAQCLHHNIRREKHNAVREQRQSQVRELVEFAEVLVKDVKGGILAPSGKAHVHLLGIFKESGLRDKGVEFWKWLEEKGEPYVDVDCYAAAIELLAYDGVPLVELNKLYDEALGQFPGSFAAYHLTPHAVLPDREKLFTVGGIPISLLQSILTARLLNGNTRDAYLALDTALRILPDQVPTRLFWLFLEERPLQEAYAVFALACRGGNALSVAYYRSMLGALRARSSLQSPAEHALGLRAMLSVTYMFIGSGGTVATNSVNETVIAATQFLRVKGVETLSSQEKQRLVNETMNIIRGIFDIFARYGAKPSIPAFNSIITNFGGFGGSRQTIGSALKDANALGLAPTDVTWRSILAVAGMLQDKKLVETTWGHLRDSRIENGNHPRSTDFYALVKPAHLSDAVGFAQEELDKFRDVLGADAYETILYRLKDSNESENHVTENVETVDFNELLAEVENIEKDLKIMKDRMQGRPAMQDFSEQPLPMTLQPLRSSLSVPEAQLRQIYNEFTTDPSAQPAGSLQYDALTSNDPGSTSAHDASVAAKSKTNIPFGELRFVNWKMMNYLLELSESTDRAFNAKVDEAIAKGTVPPKRTRGLAEEGEEVVSWGLSSVAGHKVKESGSQGGGAVGEEEVRVVREEIARLRNRHPRVT